MNMELGQLRAIVALSELTSFSRAAERLNLSTPAVFNQVRQLEEHLGGRLYERVGRRLELTERGKLLAQHARNILAAHDQAVTELVATAVPRREVLRIGSGPFSSVRIVPFLLRAYLRFYESVDIRLMAGDDQTLLRDLRSGVLDAVLLSLPLRDPELKEQPLWNYEMVFVLPPCHFPEWHKGRGLADLADKPFILFRRPVVVEQAIHKLSAGAGFVPRVVMENDDPASIRELVKLGLGFSILPLWTVGEDWRRKEISILRGSEPSLHQYGILSRASGYEPKALSDLRAVATAYAEWWPDARFVAPAGAPAHS